MRQTCAPNNGPDILSLYLRAVFSYCGNKDVFSYHGKVLGRCLEALISAPVLEILYAEALNLFSVCVCVCVCVCDFVLFLYRGSFRHLEECL